MRIGDCSACLPDLPVNEVLPDLLASLAARPNAVLIAPPGAGKTTLVPLALLDAAWLGSGRILLLEPRRLAARAAARRMAALLGEEVGGTVGYAMRMDSRQSAKTRILIVTEGILARMILDDPELPGISAILFDEFHERSLDGDFGLALALDVQGGLRPELRLLVMSATLDGARVAGLLGDAPVLRSEGRSFPVDLRYDERPGTVAVEDAVAKAIRDALAGESGSVLAFLPGQREIERTAERLAGRVGADVDIVPLYGNLDGKAQDAAIRPAPEGRRKVVLATSIAETSITIDGVRVVVDSRPVAAAEIRAGNRHHAARNRACQPGLGGPARRPRRPHAARRGDQAVARRADRGAAGIRAAGDSRGRSFRHCCSIARRSACPTRRSSPSSTRRRCPPSMKRARC